MNTHPSTHSEHVTDRNVFGFWVYLMSDCVLFAALFATYMVLKGGTAGGPTPEEITNLPLIFIATLLLLTSSFTVGLSTLAAKAGRKRLTLALLAATLLLGLGFLGLESYEFSGLLAEGSGPQRSAFLSAFFVLVGTHGLHVFGGIVWMSALMAHLLRRGLTEAGVRKLTLFSLFWHFLDIIWICVFTLVYLFGVLSV